MNNLQRVTLLALCFARAFSAESAQAKSINFPIEGIAALAIAVHAAELKAHQELHKHDGIIVCPKHTASIQALKNMVSDKEAFMQKINRVQIFKHLETIKQEYRFQKNAYSQEIISTIGKAVRCLIRINNKNAKDELFDLLTQLIELDEKAQDAWLK